MKLRFFLVQAFFGFFILALIGRLFYWQIVKSESLSTQGRSQHQSGQTIAAPRGNILASDGSFLAATSRAWLLFVQKPELTESSRSVANKLAPFLVENPEDKGELLAEASRIEEIIERKDLVWVPIKRKVVPDIKNNIEALGIRGVGFDPEEARYYPEGSASAHLLGFVGKDESGEDRGYFGLEGYYDLSLSGKPGFIQGESDTRGIPIISGGSKEISAVSGVDLLTHIDKRIQLLVEEKLKVGMERYGAVEGSVIVMNPATGAILAMASYPSYDPGKYSDFSNQYFKNPVISNAFEPGSIFKPLVMAAGLDAGVIKPDTKCDVCDGPVKVDKYEIETWNKEYNPDSTMTDVIVHSDNVGMTFIGNKLGADKLYDYLEKYGLGKTTGIDLQGEASPALRKKGEWNIVDLATATFGQGVAVTPIQMIKAFSAIANKGRTVTPQIVREIAKEGWGDQVKPQISGQVISEKAALETTAMMVAAVRDGESKWTQARGFSVAGKTGTAQIPVAGHYDAEKTVASFVGFAPANNPKFIMLISLREPQSSQWASETAAPLWFNIAKELFPYLGIQPEN